MDKFAKELGITKEGTTEDNRYVIMLDNSDEYSVIYSILDKSELVELDTFDMLVTPKTSELNYFNDEFKVKLVGNFEKDIYKVIIAKNTEEPEEEEF